MIAPHIDSTTSKHPDYKSLVLHVTEKRSQAVQALVDLEHEKRPYSIEEIVEHIQSTSLNVIDLSECQINISFDFRDVLKEVKK